MAVRADTQTLHQEAREQIRQALLSYEGDPKHVAIYALRRAMDWNELQTALSRQDAPSDPERVKTICDAVRGHIEDELRSYLDIGSL